MKLAVMQPYFFPYLGYFQLLHAVDLFVSLDDVNYIKKGWINRNYILLRCQPHRITVPLSQASQFKSIATTRIAAAELWQERLLKTLQQGYARAPFFKPVYTLAEEVIKAPSGSLADLALGSIRAVMDHLSLPAKIHASSSNYGNRSLKGAARILDICKRENATAYYNLPGGEALYEPAAFAAEGIELHFIQPGEPRYQQFDCSFVPRLSILDVLMFNAPEKVREFLCCYGTR